MCEEFENVCDETMCDESVCEKNMCNETMCDEMGKLKTCVTDFETMCDGSSD